MNWRCNTVLLGGRPGLKPTRLGSHGFNLFFRHRALPYMNNPKIVSSMEGHRSHIPAAGTLPFSGCNGIVLLRILPHCTPQRTCACKGHDHLGASHRMWAVRVLMSSSSHGICTCVAFRASLLAAICSKVSKRVGDALHHNKNSER